MRGAYLPKIIESPSLQEEWLEDFDNVKSINPQGSLVEINERGNYENFILKCKERVCSHAQLEISKQTSTTAKEYSDSINYQCENGEISIQSIPLAMEMSKTFEDYAKGARCRNGYKCTDPCGFKEGIELERMI